MFDFVLIDGEKGSYLAFWGAIQLHLAVHSVIIFDNMIAFPKKTKSFYDTIKSIAGFDQILLPIDDDGILVLAS
jgi:predicted O-methyltransferase YrrM